MIRSMFLFSLVVLWVVPAWALTLSADAAAPEEPIEITSQRLDADDRSGTAVFSGQVIAKRGDMTLYAESLTLYRAATTKQLERIEASGGVRIVQQDRVATAQRVRYELPEEKLVLIGDAHIQQGQNQVSGAEIIYFVEENRSLVKSGEDGRVRAVFFPEKEQK